MSRAVSAPSKSLGRRRRRLARNRFTVDSDALSASSPEKEAQPPPATGGDTDRWVEEQFDLAQYEDQEDVKETDILSDEDEFCEAIKGTAVDRELHVRLQAASLGQRERGRRALDTHASRMTQLRKQAALSGILGGLESPGGEEVIWVRREDFAPSRKLNTEI